MKIKLLLKNTLLIAAGLLAGATSVWADAGDVTTNANIDFSNAIVSNKVAGTVNEIAVNGGEISANGTLYMRNGDNSVVIPSAEYAGAKDVVTVSFDLAVGKLSGKNVHFYFYDSSDTKLAGFAYKVYNTEITENDFDIAMADFYTGANESDYSKATRITIEFNYATKKITTTTVCSSATNTSSNHVKDMSFSNPIAKFVIGADYNTQDNTKGRRCQVDNILIQTTEGDYATAKTITLAFKDNEDNDISGLYTGATVFTPDAGTTFTPSDYYPAVMYDGANKYTYTSGGDAFEVTADATVTLVYAKSVRPTYNIKATQSYGGKTKVIYNEDIYEASDYSYYYPKYILDGTTLYQYSSSNDPNASASYWTSAGSNVTATGDYTLTYTAIEGECVYFSEAEEIADATQWSFSDYMGKMSNGNSGVFSEKSFTTLDAGIYTIAASAIGRANDRYINFYQDAVSDGNKILTVTSKNNGNEESADFYLAESKDIIVDGGNAGGSSGHACDYIYIIKKNSGVLPALSDGGAVQLTFDNTTSGSNAWDNWIIDVWNGGSKVAKVRADWHDEVAGNNEDFTYGYTYSTDGGATPNNTNVWNSFVTDMANAAVDLTLSYSNGTLYIVGTMTNGQNVYYVNYAKSGLTGDISYNLYGNNAALSNINTSSASVVTNPTAHPDHVAVALDNNGYATYANNVYPLNLTSAKAYKAAIEGDKVKFTLFEQAVPASTGMLVEGEKSGTVNLLIADEGTTVAGNEFFVNETGEKFSAENGYTYYAMKKNSSPLTFGTFDPSTLAFPAAKAYLKVTSVADAKALTAIFGDDVTGISQVANAEAKGGNAIYNIAGQCVSQPTKGLYIIDGKKVVIK